MKKTIKKVLALVMALACVMSIAAVSAFAAAPADGTYTVPVKIWNADKDQESMSSPMMADTATVTVSGGQITMTVSAAKNAKVMGLSTKLVELQTADASGKLVATQKNGDSFTFTVTPDQWNKGMVNAKYKADIANIPADLMGSMSSRDIRIKIDTSKLTPSAAATTTDATTGASNNPLSQVFSQISSLLKK